MEMLGDERYRVIEDHAPRGGFPSIFDDDESEVFYNEITDDRAH